jgi:60 kDa SS-A/Ro ribonucleoprotein
MAKINVNKNKNLKTHEGAPAKNIPAELQLRRSVLSCLLWERQFYEDGVEIAERVAGLIPKVDPQKVALLAIEARELMKLRHMPLFIVREMARIPSHKHLVASILEQVIQRADELPEFLAIYWKDGRMPLSAQIKKGLARAFVKFDAYQLAKYNRDNVVKLRDVLFMIHAKPKDDEQAAVWKKLADETLEPPDTWEVALSAGKDKKETWERLLGERKLGALALLRNLRNMISVGVDEKLVKKALEEMKAEKVLPFRFIAAARYAPRWEPYLEKAMFKCIEETARFKGRTALLVDVSGSMDMPLSAKSDMIRMDAACGLAVLAREICESVDVFTFSNLVKEVPPRRGFALRDAIIQSQPHQSTLLGAAVEEVSKRRRYGRIIVLTDEQSHDKVPNPQEIGYMINVASYKNGVGYGAWTHIDGWSEAVLKYVKELETFNDSVFVA